jgi:glycosyltransferase involved in cell wall biosynthesis
MFCPGDGSIIPNPYIPIHTVENVPYQIAQFKPDAILVWADGTRPNIQPLQASGIPVYLLFTGGDCNLPSFAGFKHIFVENTSYLDVFKSKGYSTSIAFGTNTDLYQPIPDQPKVIDILFPATFALWKRHKLFAEAVGPLPGVKIACGFIQPELESECWQDCQKAGIAVLPHVSGKALHRLYAASKCVCITSMSIGGSQRTVLEAMAMNIPLVVNGQSEKTTEYLKDGGFGIIVDPTADAIREGIAQIKPVNTRDYVLSKWSHGCYAKAIEDTICA